MPFGFTFLLFGAFFFAFELHGVGVFLVFSFLQEAVLAASVLWWVRRVDHAPMSTLGWAGFAWGDIGFGLAMGVAVIVGSSVANLIVQEIVRAILGHVPTSSTVASELHGWATIPLTVLIAAAAPVCEELFFRGFLYQALKQRFRLGTATIVSAAAFAFVHFQPLNFVGLTVGGVILAVTFEQRRSLVSSMVAHATLNALVIGITLASR
jgi:hypothetical protein